MYEVVEAHLSRQPARKDYPYVASEPRTDALARSQDRRSAERTLEGHSISRLVLGIGLPDPATQEPDDRAYHRTDQ